MWLRNFGQILYTQALRFLRSGAFVLANQFNSLKGHKIDLPVVPESDISAIYGFIRVVVLFSVLGAIGGHVYASRADISLIMVEWIAVGLALLIIFFHQRNSAWSTLFSTGLIVGLSYGFSLALFKVFWYHQLWTLFNVVTEPVIFGMAGAMISIIFYKIFSSLTFFFLRRF